MKKYPEALDAFLGCISAFPKFIMGFMNKALVEQTLEKPAESLASLEKA